MRAALCPQLSRLTTLCVPRTWRLPCRRQCCECHYPPPRASGASPAAVSTIGTPLPPQRSGAATVLPPVSAARSAAPLLHAAKPPCEAGVAAGCRQPCLRPHKQCTEATAGDSCATWRQRCCRKATRTSESSSGSPPTLPTTKVHTAPFTHTPDLPPPHPLAWSRATHTHQAFATELAISLPPPS